MIRQKGNVLLNLEKSINIILNDNKQHHKYQKKLYIKNINNCKINNENDTIKSNNENTVYVNNKGEDIGHIKIDHKQKILVNMKNMKKN